VGIVLVASIALLFLFSASAAGDSVTRYEDPDLVTNVQGENVVEPGDTVTLNVAVQNRGSYTGEVRATPDHIAGTEAIDVPGTAIGTTAEFDDSGTPFDVRNGVQRVGLRDAQSICVAFCDG